MAFSFTHRNQEKCDHTDHTGRRDQKTCPIGMDELAKQLDRGRP